MKLLERGFRSEVQKHLVAEGAIGERLSASMFGWRHSKKMTYLLDAGIVKYALTCTRA